MIKSMTGYGKARFQNDEMFILVEIKSVNHRFREFSIRMPRAFLEFEDKVRQVVSQYIHRGKVDVFVTIEGENLIKRDIQVDWSLMEDYIDTLARAKQIHNLGAELSLDHLLQLPELFTIVEKEAETSQMGEVLLKTTSKAAMELVNMREKEGEVLYDNLGERLSQIESLLEIIKERAPTVAEDFQNRLQQKITDFLSGQIEFDETRLLTEVAVFSEKANIEEELTRLKSHISQFHTILHHGGVVGRKLDFLVQELNREINTIGSKANDTTISRQVVELKSELEMMKEQIQNIE